MFHQIGREHLEALFEDAKVFVTDFAQKPSHFAGFMVMVDR